MHKIPESLDFVFGLSNGAEILVKVDLVKKLLKLCAYIRKVFEVLENILPVIRDRRISSKIGQDL